MTIRSRIMWLCAGSVAVTALMSVGLLFRHSAAVRASIAGVVHDTAQRECERAVRDVWAMLQGQHAFAERAVLDELQAAQRRVHDAGGVAFDGPVFRWTTLNQSTGETREASLCTLRLGGRTVAPLENPGQAAFVDGLGTGPNTVASIFQRMDYRGDLLRVATTVRRDDGQRAVGSYIPAVEPDGRENEVIRSLVARRTYLGRAWVMGRWHIAAYAPIETGRRRTAGAVGVAIALEHAARPAVSAAAKLRVGRTGGVWLIEGGGEGRSHVHASPRNGKPTDAAVLATLHAARTLPPGAVVSQCHTGDVQHHASDPNSRALAYAYFEPWDWVIVAAAPEHEFADAVAPIEASLRMQLRATIIGATILLGLVWSVAALAALRIVRPLSQLAGAMDAMTARIAATLPEGRTQG